MPRIGRVVGRGSVEQVIERANEAGTLVEAPLSEFTSAAR